MVASEQRVAGGESSLWMDYILTRFVSEGVHTRKRGLQNPLTFGLYSFPAGWGLVATKAQPEWPFLPSALGLF